MHLMLKVFFPIQQASFETCQPIGCEIAPLIAAQPLEMGDSV